MEQIESIGIEFPEIKWFQFNLCRVFPWHSLVNAEKT